MDKFKQHFKDKITPRQDESGHYRVDPFKDSQDALRNAEFSKRDREVFFNTAYADILSDLFIAWLKSEPYAEKERAFLFASAMALGSLKAKMIQIETYGNNVSFINQKTQEGGNNDE